MRKGRRGGHSETHVLKTFLRRTHSARHAAASAASCARSATETSGVPARSGARRVRAVSVWEAAQRGEASQSPVRTLAVQNVRVARRRWRLTAESTPSSERANASSVGVALIFASSGLGQMRRRGSAAWSRRSGAVPVESARTSAASVLFSSSMLLCSFSRSASLSAETSSSLSWFATKNVVFPECTRQYS